MPMLSKCPRCLGIIQLEDHYTDPGMHMDCPRCQASFPLHEALDLMAEPVQEATVSPSPSTEAPVMGPGYQSLQTPAAGGYSIEQPANAPTYPTQQPIDTSYDPQANAPAGDPSVPIEPQADNGAADFAGNGQGEVPVGEDGGEFGVSDVEESGAVNPNPFLGTEENEFDIGGDSEGESYAAQTAARRAEGPSVIGTLVGVFGGGFFGLFGGYYALCYVGGAQYNFLKLNLPGLEAVAEDNSSDPNLADPVSEEDRTNQFASAPDINFIPATPAPEPNGRSLADLVPDAGSNNNNTTKPPENLTPDPEPNIPAPVAKPGTIAGAPSFSSDQLGEQLKAVSDRWSASGGVASLEDFNAVCDLAEKYTFVDESGDNFSKLSGRKSATKTMLKRYAGDASLQGSLNSFALIELDSTTHDRNGIALAGMVLEVHRSGELVEFTVLPVEGTTPIVVTAKAQLGVTEGAKFLFSGVIVSKPSENLEGYQGDQPQIVYVSYAVRLLK